LNRSKRQAIPHPEPWIQVYLDAHLSHCMLSQAIREREQALLQTLEVVGEVGEQDLGGILVAGLNAQRDLWGRSVFQRYISALSDWSKNSEGVPVHYRFLDKGPKVRSWQVCVPLSSLVSYFLQYRLTSSAVLHCSSS